MLSSAMQHIFNILQQHWSCQSLCPHYPSVGLLVHLAFRTSTFKDFFAGAQKRKKHFLQIIELLKQTARGGERSVTPDQALPSLKETTERKRASLRKNEQTNRQSRYTVNCHWMDSKSSPARINLQPSSKSISCWQE